jgi:hypothetical protein
MRGFTHFKHSHSAYIPAVSLLRLGKRLFGSFKTFSYAADLEFQTFGAF